MFLPKRFQVAENIQHHENFFSRLKAFCLLILHEIGWNVEVVLIKRIKNREEKDLQLHSNIFWNSGQEHDELWPALVWSKCFFFFFNYEEMKEDSLYLLINILDEEMILAVQRMSSEGQKTLIWILAFFLTSGKMQGKFLSLLESQFLL